MSFRLRTKAEKWFSEVDGSEPFSTKFDLYYFCVMVGLASGRRSEPSDSDDTAREIVDHFIQDYQGAQHLVLGLLVVAKARRAGIRLKEKDEVRKVFGRLLTPTSNTGLTDKGMQLLNSYASGGFDFMAESRKSKPASPDEFLRDFLQLMDTAVETAGKNYSIE